MSEARAPGDLAADFFVLRTPLLPFDELEAWSAGLAAPGSGPDELEAAVAADRERLRDRLRVLIDRPEVREALFVASPNLLEALDGWRRDPDSKKGRRAEEALVRYFLRMTARATPFGLFSGCAVGRIGERSRLCLAGRESYRRRTRLDMDYLFALTEDLGRSAHLRRVLRFHPNSSLYAAAGRLRYAEFHLQGLARVHQLVGVDANPFLDEVLRRTHGGATMAELAQALVASDPEGEIAVEEAEEFIGELIDTQILVSDLSPLVTGREAVEDLIDQLAAHPVAAPVAERLAQARAALADLDAGGVGGEGGPERYRTIARGLGELPARIDLQRIFQVDMIKPAPGSTLGPEVLAEIERGLRLLRRVAEVPRDSALTSFRREFTERYGSGRAVPLTEVLDEEIGIGFRRSRAAASEGSPLLAGLIFPQEPAPVTTAEAAWHRVLLKKLAAALAAGADEIEITDQDLAALPPDRLPPQPDAFQVLVALAAPSAEALARGELRLLLRNAFGPSGVRLLGRFCHADEELRTCVEDHLRAEEALQPDAVFAEIVHLPEGRVGNILWRPVLRPYEIPYLGRSGAPEESRLPISDLLVAVSGQEIELRSARLGCRVIPRLTTAHNFAQGSLGLYRFLCSLQAQGTREALFWTWGALDSAPFLPRVTHGRLVLSRAEWRVEAEEIRRLAETAGAGRFRAVQEWRAARRLPRWVAVVERDNELVIDLGNALAVDTFIALARRSPQTILVELFPGPDELCVTGPEGRFLHELTIPFVRRREAVRRPPVPRTGAVRRTFPPGSEWLYAKLYTGTATADHVLREAVGPLVRRALAAGDADRWFFLRYGDPDWHLRVRLHGDPRRLHGAILPELAETAAALIDQGLLWRFQIDTYEREVERYGGPEGIELAEAVFEVDSDAVLAIVEGLAGAEGADARWRLALRGIDRLLADLGFAGGAKLALLRRMAESSAREFKADAAFVQQLAQRLRRERASLTGLLEPGFDPGDPLAPGLTALEERSRRLAPLVAELQAREASGRLTVSIAELALSLAHMFTNRLLRSEGRAHEVVLYDFLDRLQRSRAAQRAE